jgi:MOSC domain-containing protein YiiM
VLVGHETVLTSIFKSPVAGRVAIRQHNIDGDRQSDLTVHGGPYKAVYCYPGEHYDYWRRQLPDAELDSGAFGENLTTEGLSEESVWIGDQYRVGSALLQVTQPRMPCYKLGIRFGRPDMVKRFWVSARPGIYFSVVAEGEVAPGDAIELAARGAGVMSQARNSWGGLCERRCGVAGSGNCRSAGASAGSDCAENKRRPKPAQRGSQSACPPSEGRKCRNLKADTSVRATG